MSESYEADEVRWLDATDDLAGEALAKLAESESLRADLTLCVPCEGHPEEYALGRRCVMWDRPQAHLPDEVVIERLTWFARFGWQVQGPVTIHKLPYDGAVAAGGELGPGTQLAAWQWIVTALTEFCRPDQRADKEAGG
jgi:hypothetical protein